MEDEFAANFKAADVNNNGVLTCDEFKNCLAKNDECCRKRFGEWVAADDFALAGWFKAYNGVTPSCEGVSLEDFKFGDIVM